MKKYVVLLLATGCGSTSFTALTGSSTADQDAGADSATAPDATDSAPDAPPMVSGAGGAPGAGGSMAAGGRLAAGGALAAGGRIATGGAPTLECKPGAMRCQPGAAVAQTCDASGTWGAPAQCSPCVSPWMPCCMGSNGCACVSSAAVCAAAR